MANRKVLVTGGAGFIGSHVAEAFAALADRVWVLDDLSSGRERNIPEGVEFIRGSINDASLVNLFDRVGGFDIINHHAAQVDVRKSVADPRADAHTNLDGLLNLLENARRTGVQRFIYVSSGGVVYGEPETLPTPETARKLPLSPYGVSKLASELYLYYYHQIHGLDYVALRYGNIYGPRQDPHGEAGVIAIFCTQLIEGKPLTIYGDGLQTRDYVHVGDVVAANMLLSDASLDAAQNLDQRAFNVGTGVATSVLELARILSDVAGTSGDVIHAAERAGELRHSCLDAARLRQLGWQPQYGITDGLRNTYDYIRQQERGW